jgi:hypothetical protein
MEEDAGYTTGPLLGGNVSMSPVEQDSSSESPTYKSSKEIVLTKWKTITHFKMAKMTASLQ